MTRIDRAPRVEPPLVPVIVLLLLLALSFVHASAVIVTPSPADVQRAMKLAGEPPAARARFHALYTTPIKDSIIRDIEVLTEFRRTVIATEDALTRGDWAVAHGAGSLGGRTIADIVAPWRRMVTIVANLQFPAMHTYVSIPRCDVTLGGTPILAAIDRRTIPLSSLPYSSRGTIVTSLVGANIEVDFDAGPVGQTSRSAVVTCDGKDVARAVIDFSRMP
jgi:hypothetical protein